MGSLVVNKIQESMKEATANEMEVRQAPFAGSQPECNYGSATATTTTSPCCGNEEDIATHKQLQRVLRLNEVYLDIPN